MIARMLSITCVLSCACALVSADSVIYGEGVAGFDATGAGMAAKMIYDDPARGAVLRLTVGSAPDHIWKAQTFVRPLIADVAAGSNIAVSFRARCIQPGQGRLNVQLGLAKEPYPVALGQSFELGQEWAFYSMKGTAAIPLAAADGRFGFMFGHQSQTIEISSLRITSGDGQPDSPAAVGVADGAIVDVPADKSAFHIFVLIGQSNMGGSSLPVPMEYVDPSNDVLVLRGDLVWRKASTPLDPMHGGAFSLGESFARHYAALHPGVQVGLIQCARGGRGIMELTKNGKDRGDGTHNYGESIRRISAAMQRGTLKGMLWHQGETDCGDAGYNAKLATLVADLRADTGIADLPVIAGQLGQYATWTRTFNGRITGVAQSIPHCGVATSEGLLDLGDKVHFSGYASEVLGARYLEQYLQLAEPSLVATWKPRVAEIATAMAQREKAWVGVLNGDMSEGVSRPFAWDLRRTGNGNIRVTRDASTFASPPASLRITSVDGTTQSSIAQPLRNVSGKKLTISAKIRCDGVVAAQVLVTAIDKKYKPCFNSVVLTTGPTPEWKEMTAEVTVPAEAMSAKLALGVNGDGTAWFDDVRLTVEQP